MATYKCFKCGEKITAEELEKRFTCTHCGSMIFHKPRTKTKTVKTD